MNKKNLITEAILISAIVLVFIGTIITFSGQEPMKAATMDSIQKESVSSLKKLASTESLVEVNVSTYSEFWQKFNTQAALMKDETSPMVSSNTIEAIKVNFLDTFGLVLDEKTQALVYYKSDLTRLVTPVQLYCLTKFYGKDNALVKATEFCAL